MKLSSAVLALACGLLAQPLGADWPPPGYEATYDLYMDGKPRGETRVRFTREDNDWRFENEAEGNKGLAGFLGAETSESASGTLTANQVLPAHFSHRYKISFKKDRWSAEFDWDEGKVRTRHDDDVLEFPLQPGTVDPLGLTLEMQRLLTLNETEWETHVVDEDEIDLQRFRALPPEELKTALGCLDAIEIERVRENSKRYSSVWLAPDLHFVTVRIIHGKRDGNEFEMRLRALRFDGEPVPTRNDCPGNDPS